MERIVWGYPQSVLCLHFQRTTSPFTVLKNLFPKPTCACTILPLHSSSFTPSVEWNSIRLVFDTLPHGHWPEQSVSWNVWWKEIYCQVNIYNPYNKSSNKVRYLIQSKMADHSYCWHSKSNKVKLNHLINHVKVKSRSHENKNETVE